MDEGRIVSGVIVSGGGVGLVIEVAGVVDGGLSLLCCRSEGIRWESLNTTICPGKPVLTLAVRLLVLDPPPAVLGLRAPVQKIPQVSVPCQTICQLSLLAGGGLVP